MNDANKDLNIWLSANHQKAIDTLQKQGMTLSFVDGAQNYHQDKPSLAVGFEGVGFTFQMNRHARQDVNLLVDDAVRRADDFQKAFTDAKETYGARPLPMSDSRSPAAPLLVRGQCWDVCNHQDQTSERERQSQRLQWARHSASDQSQDVAAMVTTLCERQTMLDRLRTTEGLLAVVREPDALLWRESLDAFALNDDRECLLMLDIQDDDNGRSVVTQALYWDSCYSNFSPLGSESCAKLSSQGVVVHNDGCSSLTHNIDAHDLGLEQGSLGTMADMGMQPIDILRFDAQKAESEVSAGEDYLASLDGDVFFSEQAQDQAQGIIR